MSPSAMSLIAMICRPLSFFISASLKAALKALRLAVRGDNSWPVLDTCSTGILGKPGLAAYSGEGKPGGERGGVFIHEGCFRGGGVRGAAAAGTEGAGLGAPLGRALGGVEGTLGAGLGVGEGETLSPLSWAAILFPATHSVSKFFARSNTTFALI